MKGCKHKGLLYEGAFWIECCDCGAWLPLGPSNDSPSEVQQEIRAADIAVHWSEQNHRPGYDRFEWCPETKTDELCGRCQSDYLAHRIAKHDGGAP